MGIAYADIDSDLDFDALMTHWQMETNTLYLNDGAGTFKDRSQLSGIAKHSKGFTAFGTQWLDVNGDELLDLFVLNGAVTSQSEQKLQGDPFPLKQRPQVLLQMPDLIFEPLLDADFGFLHETQVGRASLLVDFNNDGTTELLTLANHGQLKAIELNEPAARWMGLELFDVWGKVALGTRVLVTFNDGTQSILRQHNDGSYLVSQDHRIRHNLSAERRPVSLTVLWPDGESQQITVDWPLDRYHQIRQMH